MKEMESKTESRYEYRKLQEKKKHMIARDRAVILLVGLPQLNNTLQLSIHEPLRQRIIMNYNVEGYSKEEGRAYIEWKLKKAGCTAPVFDDAAI